MQTTSEIGIEIVDDFTCITINLNNDSIKDWICCLYCVMNKLDPVTKSSWSGYTIQMSICDTNTAFFSDKNIKLGIDHNTADMIAYNFAKYFKFGIADVDHLDIDLDVNNKNGYITFKFENSFAPVSQEEALKKLR
ncbi:hypothetical protein ACQKJ1_19845 [Methylorubrum rhodesianum]|uniref:hypothetical protein n=1 Tax=Methylorubrum rhodesianum TaxID=29427 RepID=UPI003D061E4A